MTEAVVVTGARGEVVLLNGAARRMFGLAPEANYRGPRFRRAVPRPAPAGVRRTRRLPRKRNEVMTAEFLIQLPAVRHLEVSAAPVRQADGTAGGASSRLS